MAINLRSPHYIDSGVDASLEYAELKLYIFTGSLSAIPSTPDYTIRKSLLQNNTTIDFEISELVRDFLDITFDGSYDAQTVWAVSKIYSYNSFDEIIRLEVYEDLCFDGYNYFEEPINFTYDTEGIFNPNYIEVLNKNWGNETLLISNNVIYNLADNLVRIPINTYNKPTLLFIKDGNVIASHTYSRLITTDDSIKYVTINGEASYDNYKERVINDGGVVEDTKCLKEFFNEFEIGECDSVRIINDASVSPEIVADIQIKNINECKYEPKKVTFVNKFGVLQDMYFFKKSVEKMTVKKESYKANILSGNTYDRTHHVNREFNVIGNESVTLSSGYLSEDYNEVFKQLLLSEKVWMTNLTDTEEQVLPINVKTSNITYKTSLNDRLVEYTIEFDKSFDTITNIR